MAFSDNYGLVLKFSQYSLYPIWVFSKQIHYMQLFYDAFNKNFLFQQFQNSHFWLSSIENIKLFIKINNFYINPTVYLNDSEII